MDVCKPILSNTHQIILLYHNKNFKNKICLNTKLESNQCRSLIVSKVSYSKIKGYKTKVIETSVIYFTLVFCCCFFPFGTILRLQFSP